MTIETHRTCNRCGLTKKITSFGISSKIYRRRFCETCRERKDKLLPKRRDYKKNYVKNNRDYFNKKHDIWKKNNRTQYLAGSRFNNLVKHFNISKPNCYLCGELKVEAHHVDYKKPYYVCWLCKTCHRKSDIGEIKESQYIKGMFDYSELREKQLEEMRNKCLYKINYSN